MVSVIIVYPGPPEQKQTIKVTAMQPLSAVLPGACSKFKPSLEPSTAKLTLNKKPVDITSPFRLINIPNGSILTISASPAAAPVATADLTPVAAPVAAAPIAADTVTAAPVPVAPATAMAAALAPVTVVPITQASDVTSAFPPQQPTAAQPQVLSQPIVPEPQAAYITQLPQPPTNQPMQIPLVAPPPAPEVQMEDVQVMEPAPTQITATAEELQQEPAATTAEATSGLDLLQLSTALGWFPGREALLTTEVALQHHALQLQHGGTSGTQGAMDVDPAGEDDDSFYELTPEDLADMIRSTEAKKKEEAAGLKTQAMREAEERAKIQSLGPVALRLRFRDGVVFQAAFKASDKLSLVLDVVRTLLSSPRTPITLFTTPPKQIIKDLDVTLYKAGLVPAALVHVQLPEDAGSTLDVLRPEVAACLHTTIPTSQTLLPGQHSHFDSSTSTSGAGAGSSGPGARGAAAKSGVGVGGSGGLSSSGVAASLGRILGGGSHGQEGPTASSSAGGNPKVPRWLKMGK